MPNDYLSFLRQSVKLNRTKLNQDERFSASSKIVSIIKKTPSYRKAKHLAFYRAHMGEVCLLNLWHTASKHGKYCYFPCIQDDDSLLFYPATPSTMFVPNKYNILEPIIDNIEPKDINQLDIIFTPLVAFDNCCNRIGMGAGYYDRSFAKLHNPRHPRLVGIAHQFQCFEYLPQNATDVPLDTVITPVRIYRKP